MTIIRNINYVIAYAKPKIARLMCDFAIVESLARVRCASGRKFPNSSRRDFAVAKFSRVRARARAHILKRDAAYTRL